MSSTVSNDQILACITKMQEGFENRFAAQDQRMKALEEDISALKNSAQAVELAKKQITRYIDTAQNQLAETCRAIQVSNSKKMEEFFKGMRTSFKQLFGDETNDEKGTGSSSKVNDMLSTD